MKNNDTNTSTAQKSFKQNNNSNTTLPAKFTSKLNENTLKMPRGLIIPKKYIDFEDYWHDSSMLVTDKFEAPPAILRIGDAIIGTLGNFSATTGKAKARKTFVSSAIAAAGLSLNPIINIKANLPKNKQTVLFIDTEQSKFHCQLVLKRILRLSGLSSEKHPSNLKFLSLRKYSPDDRINIIEYGLYNTKNIGIVIIDGLRDLAYDINSPQEATDIITKFMKWTDELNIHIHTVLHQNKGNDYTRGHLGTELNNKSECVISVTKDEFDNNISIVKSELNRGVDFDSFAFNIEDGLPKVVEDYEINSKKQKKQFTPEDHGRDFHIEMLSKIFQSEKSLTYKNLWQKIKTLYTDTVGSIGDNKTKEIIKYYRNNGLIIQNESKLYKMSHE